MAICVKIFYFPWFIVIVNLSLSLSLFLSLRPVLTYGAETWTMSKKEEEALLIFERKIFRRIYGPKNENGVWKSRRNLEPGRDQ
jgi:hypothetical protein